MNFKAGDRITMIEDQPWLYFPTGEFSAGPIFGEVYVAASPTYARPYRLNFDIGVVEIVGFDGAWQAEAFRRVVEDDRRTDISIFRRLLNLVRQRELEDA